MPIFGIFHIQNNVIYAFRLNQKKAFINVHSTMMIALMFKVLIIVVIVALSLSEELRGVVKKGM